VARHSHTVALRVRRIADAGKLLAWIHTNADVLTRATDDETGATTLTLRTTPENKARLDAQLSNLTPPA